jgi:hypothetical protein
MMKGREKAESGKMKAEGRVSPIQNARGWPQDAQEAQGGTFLTQILQWNPDNRSGVFTKMVKTKQGRDYHAVTDA